MAVGDHQRMGLVGPMSIVPDRYGKTYSQRGPWLAFPCELWAVPREPFEDDTPAREWWAEAEVPIGGGATPSEACLDLIERLVAIRPDRVYGPNAGDQSYMWTWDIRWLGGGDNVVDS